MKPFEKVDAVAVPLDSPNMDTDQIAPARFLRRPRDQGYSQFLFHDLRFDQQGQPKTEFIMNQPAFSDARVLVVNRNFGGGSSREQAVWCLVDHGIRCVIGSTFGDIFFNNAINHGLLLIRETQEQCAILRQQLHDHPGAHIQVDLDAQTYVSPDGRTFPFEIEANRKKRLLLGLDEIGVTMQHMAELDTFDETFRRKMSWLF